VYAIRYAHRADKTRDQHFVEADAGSPERMPMDYFCWVAIAEHQAIVIDTGFKPTAPRGQVCDYLGSPLEGLGYLGVEPANVEHVVLSHLHWDHVGNADAFLNARYIIQEQEMAFWTGRWAGRGQFGKLCDPNDLTYLVRANLAGRVTWVDGDAEILPGLSVHLVGGHTAGIQVTRVATERGAVVLATDAAHFYANLEADRPFRTLHALPGMYAAFDRIRTLASDPTCIVAGHDPAVLERYPPVSPELAGRVVRIA